MRIFRGCFLLTFDKDFGELVGRSALPKACGVVLVRAVLARSDDIGRFLTRMRRLGN